MNQNQLGENIARYRKEKGLSQEKVSEYMDVSRQAVTKWESNSSKPSSKNLIKLAKLFDVSVEDLLNSGDCVNAVDKVGVTTDKSPWIFISISMICFIAYIMIGNLLDTFQVGTLICMFVITIPIQLFLHIYFTNAINNDSFSGIAGYDERIEYNHHEVKKLLIQIDLHTEMMSTLYVFLLCVMNCIDLKMGWINGILMCLYLLNFMGNILINNYKAIDKIYCKEEDKKRSKCSLPITTVYVFLLFMGMGLFAFICEIKGIENNTAPAIKLAGILLLAILVLTIGYFLENHNIKKWCPDHAQYKISKTGIGSLLICIALYALMCVM